MSSPSAMFEPDTPARVLVLMEQSVLADAVAFALNHGVYVTSSARSMVEASTLLNEWQPHVAVIDMDIIGGDQFMQRVGSAASATAARLPVLAMTRRGDLRTRLAAFEQGVDDILTVPFSPEELLARLLALTRRAYGATVSIKPTIKVGDLEINIVDRQVRMGRVLVHLTGMEQSLLYLLVANAGRLLTRNDIMDALWGTDYEAESNVVDWHIRNLRAKLQDDWRKARFIATEPGRGYRFIAKTS